MSGHELSARLRTAGLDWIVPDWQVASSVHGLVTTRNGGVSQGARASLDMGSAQANEADVIENRRRVRAFLPSDPHWLHQVHGTEVVRLDRSSPASIAPAADAAVTATRGLVCAVRTADCLPVLFADVDGRAVGVAHAGWRGLASGVIEATLDALAALGAGSERIAAWLGPAIGQDAFEVGDEVRAAFIARDSAAVSAFRAGVPGKWHADLYALARQRLARRSVLAVSGGGWCTRADEARFHSWRRSRETGRMAALVWIE